MAQVGATSALRREVVAAGKHSLIYAIGQALSRAVGFFMIPVYTRYIEPRGYGAMELIDILFNACLLLLTMGVADAMSRFYYAEKVQGARDRVVSTVVIGLAAIGLPIVLLLLLASPGLCRAVVEEPEYESCFRVAMLTAWFSMLCDVGYTYLRMRYRAKTFVLVTTGQLAAALALNIYFVVALGWGVFGIFCSTLITQGITGICLAVAMLWEVGWRFSPSVFGAIARFGLPLVPPQVGWILVLYSNRFFLRWYGSPDPLVALALVGVLSLGFKFGLIVNRFINVPFNSFWAPRRLELLLSDEPHARETVARMCTYAALCAMFCALFLAATITPVVAIMANPSYSEAAAVVPFVALTYVAIGLQMHFKTALLYRRKTLWETAISIPSLGVIVLWNYLLIPRFGLMGAATSNLAGFVLQATLVYLVCQRLYPIPFELGRLALMLLAALEVFAVSQLLNFGSPWVTLLARSACVCTFPLALAIVGFYRDGELEFLLHGVHRAREVLQGVRSWLL
jgi:O-antigen/teichoic acid export membrane protein